MWFSSGVQLSPVWIICNFLTLQGEIIFSSLCVQVPILGDRSGESYCACREFPYLAEISYGFD